MSSSNKRSARMSLPLKLTLSYVFFFTAASGAVFLAVNEMLQRSLLERMDRALLSDVRNYVDLASRRKTRIMQKTFEREALFEGSDQVFLRILSPERVVLAVWGESGWASDSSALEPPDSTTPDIPGYRTVLLADGEHRARVISLTDLEGRMFQVGRSLCTYDSIISSYRSIGGVGLALTIVLGSALSYALLRQTVLRVEKVRCAAVAIGKTDLARRVETRSGGDEIDALARAFNAMLDRIAMLVDELKILSSNIAHDLRGPIARIRGTAELAATGKPDIGELQESAGIVVEECDRLDSVIGTMLEIAQTEAGIVRYKRERIDIKQLLSEAVQLFSPLAEDKTIGLSLALPEQDVLFWGDRSALQRVVANLLDNALKYTSADGKVAVRCEVVESGIRIRVADTGVGIALPDLPHIFDRFFRCETSRTSDGCGLGLSLAQALTKAQEGQITVESSPGSGSTFCINLPTSPFRT